MAANIVNSAFTSQLAGTKTPTLGTNPRGGPGFGPAKRTAKTANASKSKTVDKWPALAKTKR